MNWTSSVNSYLRCAAKSTRVGGLAGLPERDLRLDFFRGVALWLIFLDHIPSNIFSWITIRSYGFSDATEIFIFISGYTSCLVYGRAMRDDGFIVGAAKILRRAWQLYVAHIFLFAVYVAQVSYVAASYDAPVFAQKAQIVSLFMNPDISVVQALLLNFKPVNLDVLPIYILFLLAFVPGVWLLQRAPNLVLAISGVLYASVRACGWDIPAYPDGYWFFNPLAWQFLFMLGAWFAASGAVRLSPMIRTRTTATLAIIYLLVAFMIAMTWHSGLCAALEPDWLKQLIIQHPTHKTNLHPLRLLHFCALTALALKLVPRKWQGLEMPIVRPVLLCGQHSLEIFCASVFLAFVAHYIIVEMSSTIAMQILVSTLGIAILIAIAWLMSWYQKIDDRKLGAEATV